MAININGVSLSSANGSTFSVDSGATNWLTCNANGIITQPRPYLFATLSGQGTFYRAATVTFGNIVANVGSCWNNSTGLFTCPVAGRYLVSMGGIAGGTAVGAPGSFGYGYCYINKNGSTFHFSHWNHASNWEYMSLSGIVGCNAGDTISFRIFESYGSWYGGGDHGCFFIVLLR